EPTARTGAEPGEHVGVEPNGTWERQPTTVAAGYVTATTVAQNQTGPSAPRRAGWLLGRSEGISALGRNRPGASRRTRFFRPAAGSPAVWGVLRSRPQQALTRAAVPGSCRR